MERSPLFYLTAFLEAFLHFDELKEILMDQNETLAAIEAACHDLRADVQAGNDKLAQVATLVEQLRQDHPDDPALTARLQTILDMLGVVDTVAEDTVQDADAILNPATPPVEPMP